MRWSASNITAIDQANAIPILDVAQALNIEVKGKKAMCFGGHDHKTPSLSFNPSRNLWYCHGCGKGGANIQLVMVALQLQFKDALAWMGRQFHFPVGMISTRRVHARTARRTVIKPKVFDNASAQPDSDVYEWILQNCPLRDEG